MNTIDRDCLCKRRFDTEAEAEAEIHRINDDPDAHRWQRHPLRCYPCRYGNHWHIAKVRAIFTGRDYTKPLEGASQ